MRGAVLSCVLALALALALALSATAQQAPVAGEPRRGTNYDPPPRPREKTPEPPAADRPEPLFTIPDIDWDSRETWVKLGLLVGAIVLARKAFHEMKG